MTLWFGVTWEAPICDPDNKVPTPVGATCGWCEEEIDDQDRGVALPYVGPDDSGCVVTGDRIARLPYDTFLAYHVECWLRTVLGSAGHIEGRCHCVLGEAGEEDPPGITRRQAAAAALAAYERKHGGRVT